MPCAALASVNKSRAMLTTEVIVKLCAELAKISKSRAVDTAPPVTLKDCAEPDRFSKKVLARVK